MRAIITGATGLVGRELVRHAPGAVVLSRDAARARRTLGDVEAHDWDPAVGPPPPAALDGGEVVFNLAGEPVAAGRWTRERRRRIHDSRVVGTRHLVAGLAASTRRPRVLVSASAVGYYGDRGDELLDESSSRGAGFLADVCHEWEREAVAAERLGMRVVRVRIGVVLAPGGGALARLVPVFRLGLGGPVGSGRQWMPWIHLDDVIGLMLHAASSEQVDGPLNAVGPSPVTSSEFAHQLGRAVHRPAIVPVPGVALRVAFGEMSEVLTASQRALPRVAERTGYAFRHDHLDEALAAVLSAGDAAASRPRSTPS